MMCTCKHNRVFRRDRESSKVQEAALKRLRRKGRKLEEFVYERVNYFVQAYRIPLGEG